jgi:hypothetical protein
MDEDTPDLCEDLRNVTEGDDVLLTTEEDRFTATVTSIITHHSTDPDVVRETTSIWFDQEGAECMVQVTDGLTRFEWEDDYPRHTPLYDETNDESLGYITDVEIAAHSSNRKP